MSVPRRRQVLVGVLAAGLLLSGRDLPDNPTRADLQDGLYRVKNETCRA